MFQMDTTSLEDSNPANGTVTFVSFDAVTQKSCILSAALRAKHKWLQRDEAVVYVPCTGRVRVLQ